MASLISHGIVSLAAGSGVYSFRMPTRFWWLSLACSIAPDLDVIGFALGIRYGDLLGHRGFSHSLLAAILLGFLVTALAFRETPRFTRRWWGLWAYFAGVTASHGLLDAMTDGGLGVAFFSPFEATRYFLPWRPIAVSPIGIADFFSEWGLYVLWSELVWIWLPCTLASGACFLLRIAMRKGSASAAPSDSTELQDR